jgi:hypothetical protein
LRSAAARAAGLRRRGIIFSVIPNAGVAFVAAAGRAVVVAAAGRAVNVVVVVVAIRLVSGAITAAPVAAVVVLTPVLVAPAGRSVVTAAIV